MDWGGLLSSSDDLKKRKRSNLLLSQNHLVPHVAAPLAKSGHVIEIEANNFRGAKTMVNFPYEPYGIQRDFVKKLVQTLESGGNALLESPTGTGKTACLLCGTLSWQKQYSENLDASEVHQIQNGNGSKRQKTDIANSRQDSGKSSSGAPKVFYSSRTHSQLSQAIGELKRVQYQNIKAVVIGSRDQLCIHPEVKQENNATVKTHMCRQKVKSRTCNFYNNFEKLRESGRGLAQSSKEGGEVLDIEDLVQQGINQSVCPYFYSREMSATRANIVFMPYNYIIDPSTRKAHNVELMNNVIIFDEGHNIDSLCEESASFSVTSLEVAAAFKETQKLLERMAETDKKFQGESSSGVNLNESDVYLGDEQLTPEFNTSEVAALATIFHNLEATLLNVNVNNSNTGNSNSGFNNQKSGCVFKGSLIYSWLEDAGLKPEVTPAVIATLDKIASYLSTLQTHNAFNIRPYGIMKMANILKQLYPDQGQDAYANFFLRNCSRTEFKMHVSILEEKEKGTSNDPWAKKNTSAGALSGGDEKPRLVNYWCFSPAYALKSVVQHQVRSVIITSGTLSPLSSFETEMRMSFPWQLQNPHIVTPAQFFAAVVHSGPVGAKLSSAYNNRSNEMYLIDLGSLIANMSKVVPHGMLVFFPSYTVMSSCVDFWKGNHDIWTRITQHKPVYIEPRDKAALPEVIAQYNLDVRTREDKKGAAFFAVCRGKVSEGLDFADINGRAVIITGLPYPPQFDPRVKLKMEYLDTVTSATKENKMNPITMGKIAKPQTPVVPQTLDGKSWYQQQAIRAVNQAIGRVLRHKNDYGAILLCDERFAYSSNRSHLSSWIRSSVRDYRSFQVLPKDLKSFYRIAEMKYPYSESSSAAAMSTSRSLHTSPEKKKTSAISGHYQLKDARPGLKKSNEVTYHVTKPDWMTNEPISDNLTTYLSSENEPKKALNIGKSVLSQLLTFEDETQEKSSSQQSSTTDDISSQVSTLCSSKKKIKLVRSSRTSQEAIEDKAVAKVTLVNCKSSGISSSQAKSEITLSSNQKANHTKLNSVSAQLFSILQRELPELDFRDFKKAVLNYISDDSKKPNASYNYIARFVQSKMSSTKFSVARKLMQKYIRSEHRDHYSKLCASFTK